MAVTSHLSPRERLLAPLSLGVGVLIWLAGLSLFVRLAGGAAVAATLVAILMVLAFLGLSYLFAQSAFIAHLRGQGIEVSETQCADLYTQLQECCSALGLETAPRLFILNGNGVLNAFATWFLGRRFVILNSDIVDAMDSHSAGVRFYLGHELGHILLHDARPIAVLRWPALRLPLLGAAYSRARESSCDLHGLACCPDRESAARSLAALAAGKRRWATLSLAGARLQAEQGGGFWMSFHELTSSYPWTSKRTVRLLDESPSLPKHHPAAVFFAAFIPYAGRMGAGIGMLLYVYVIGVGAAIAIPAYQNYTIRAQLTAADAATERMRAELAAYYGRTQHVPASLEAAGLPSEIALPQEKGPALQVTYTLDSRNMTLRLHLGKATLQYVPSQNEDGTLKWACSGVPPLPSSAVPITCRP